MSLENPIPLGQSSSEVTAVATPMNSVRLFLPDVSELEKLPLCGKITFEYRRESLKLSGASDLSAELSLTAILDVEETEKDSEDSVDKLYDEATEKNDDEA